MTERLKNIGRLEEKKLAAKSLRLRIEGDIRVIRDIVDPFAPLEEMKAEVAAAQAVEMAGKHIEYIGLLADIKAIRRALGRTDSGY